MNDEKGPKHLYSIHYTIKPKVSEEMIKLQFLKELNDELVDVQMEMDGFPEANALIARIKAQL